MIDPKVAGKILEEHFKHVTLDEFKERYERHVLKGRGAPPPPADTPKVPLPLLYQHHAWPLLLTACLVTAATGQCDAERSRFDAVAEIVDSVCQGLEVDLHRAGKTADERPFGIDRKRALKSDLVVYVADCDDIGDELDFALDALLPVALVVPGDTTASRIATGVPALKLTITYADLDGLKTEFRDSLAEIRPVLEQRKLAFADFDKNLVGDKVKFARQDAGLTREDVAQHSRGLLTVARIREIEVNRDRASNPTLVELRALAALLKTTVADLVEPDLGGRVVASSSEGLAE